MTSPKVLKTIQSGATDKKVKTNGLDRPHPGPSTTPSRVSTFGTQLIGGSSSPDIPTGESPSNKTPARKHSTFVGCLFPAPNVPLVGRGRDCDDGWPCPSHFDRLVISDAHFQSNGFE